MRIKILQILYSFYKGDGQSLPVAEKELLHVFERTYDLYFHLLLLSVELTRFSTERIDARRNKFRPTEEDRNPNTRFIDNLFIKEIIRNEEFKKKVAERKISWDNNRDSLKDIFEELAATDIYKDYMSKPAAGMEHDINFWCQVYQNFAPQSAALEESLEEQSIYWCDDLEVLLSFIVKSIKRFRHNDENRQLLPMFKNDDDLEFARKLLRKTVENADEYLSVIDGHTRNWEIDRMADMDILIMQMALTEIVNFPAIPINVTLNEYINMAKMYSTENSSIFINGVLDKVVKQLKDENKLIKVVTFDNNQK